MPDLGPAWIAFGSGVAGGLLGQVGTWLTLRFNRREAVATRQHEIDLADRERSAVMLESRRLYQADTLLELQLALTRLARSSVKVMMLRLEDEAEERPPEDFRIPPELDMACFEAETFSSLLATRVEDPEIRSRVGETIGLWNHVSTGSDYAEANAAHGDANAATSEVLDRIGQALSTLPKPPAHQVLITTPLLDIDAIQSSGS